MHRLAVFDIDGTLTDTNSVDDECFVQSVAEILELERHHLDWSDAPHVTDAALLRWLADRHGRKVDQTTERAVLDRFLQLLHREQVASPWRFRPIRGAPSVRAELEKRGWQVALATGAWEPSARLKLEAIGFDTAGVPLASATDALTRTEIVRLALARSLQACGSIEHVVSVGDAVWDVRTAVAVGWAFVGVATGARADKLRAQGASTIVPDLEDVAALCRALDEAEIPRPITPVA
jgi:phosphoglycolate phosphatase-like HAD superfamily hydrolase